MPATIFLRGSTQDRTCAAFTRSATQGPIKLHGDRTRSCLKIIVPGLPHHVTPRGNPRGQVFFEDSDYTLYLDMLAESAARARCEIWAYCLMPNHVHFILVPSKTDGLRRTFADLHRRYTGYVSARARTTGHLWQGRYGSVVRDETHLFHAIRYVTLNPARAGLVKRAEEWSSARAHHAGDDNGFLKVAPVLERMGDFIQFLGEPIDEDVGEADGAGSYGTKERQKAE